MNPVESTIEIVRQTQRNVKRWRSGEMALRWTAAGTLEAERRFRRVVGHRDLPKLIAAIEHEVHGRQGAPMIEAAPDHHRTAVDFPRRAGHPPRCHVLR